MAAAKKLYLVLDYDYGDFFEATPTELDKFVDQGLQDGRMFSEVQVYDLTGMKPKSIKVDKYTLV